jgi:spore coat polysaccharide biosynthesis protein SpsF (cytidylyltransferase family)
MEQLKVLLITQARVGSSRFPNKVVQKLAETTLLGLHLERIKNSKRVTSFCVATTKEDGVDAIINIAKDQGFDVYQGSLNDVLDRFYQAAVKYQPDYVVRVTSDCPLIDSNLIDDVIDLTIKVKADYGANILIEEFPDGQDVEVFSFLALKQAWEEAKLLSEREHVTPFIRNNSSLKGGKIFKSVHLSAPSNFNHIRMTVDEPKDLLAINILLKKLGTKAFWLDYANYIIYHINEFDNQDIQRNEGYLKSLDNDLKK